MTTTPPVALGNPTGGTVVSTTGFGIPVATNVNAILGSPIFRAYASGTQSIPDNTFTPLGLDTESPGGFDTQNGHSTTVNNSRYTAQTGWSGYHAVNGQYATAGNATGARFAAIYVNGSLWPNSANGYSTPPNNGQQSIQVDDVVFLNVGDYVEIYAFQHSGGALLTNAGNSGCYMTVSWLRQ